MNSPATHVAGSGDAAPTREKRARRAKPESVFLDCAASTPVGPAVSAKMRAVADGVGANPSSVHRSGLRAAGEVELARRRIASRLGCAAESLTFTGCATEANNLAIKGAIWAAPPDRRGLVVSSIEHPSVLEVARWLDQTGQATLTVLPVDRRGRVRPADLAAALRPNTALVSIMHANNEVGTLQPLAELGAMCREHGVLFHTDACQSFLKVDIDLSTLPVDLLSINAHKVHGPKGVGALYTRPGVTLTPLLHGGGHEQGLRSGTLNVGGIAGFGEAVERFGPDDVARIRGLRDGLLASLHQIAPTLVVQTPVDEAVCNIANISVPGHSGKSLFRALDRRGFRVSASSACHSTQLTPSHVLLAMGLDEAAADQALRVSLGRFTTGVQLSAFVEALGHILKAPSEKVA
jgi:cysteine desulfurase